VTPFDEFKKQTHTRGRGRTAESDAVTWLKTHGFQIVERNVQFRAGEIDVVAREGETLCFVEIKARATANFGEAVRAVTRRKQRQITAAAALYLAATGFEGACRFDVLAMDGEAGGWRYSLIRNAFEVG